MCLLFVIYFRIVSNLWYLFKLFQENISPEIALQRVDSRLPLAEMQIQCVSIHWKCPDGEPA